MEQYLWFDSNFECGNLSRVVAVSPTEYDLYLNTDTNSPNRCQWFYFLVTNTRQNLTVKFNILNQTKYPHFYKEGMKPLVFSETDNANIYTTWTCRVENVSLTRTSAQYQSSPDVYNIGPEESPQEQSECTRPTTYVLSFTHTFKHSSDRVYFAYNRPYSFSWLSVNLGRFESALRRDAGGRTTPPTLSGEKPWVLPAVQLETRDIFYKRETLCHTEGGMPVDMIWITGSQSQTPLNKQKHVIITARVHSSETPGSYKAQGIVKFLISKDPVAEALRQEFVFVIVPMLNPDGVVLGNNRCSLGGFDLNRCWGHPSSSKQPTVYALKTRLQELVGSGKQIFVYCDLHGHSKLMNSFIYACHKVSTGTFSSWTKVRLLPRILARKCHFLDYHQCSFKVEPDKVNTARVIIWKEFKVINSFTMESSIYAYTLGEEVIRFSEREYVRIGEALMCALNDYITLLDHMQLEMSETRDWLKPGRLAELTGTPAADVLKLEIREDKEEGRRRERRERLKVKLQMNKIPSFQRVVEQKEKEKPPRPQPQKSRAISCVPANNNRTFECIPKPPSIPNVQTDSGKINRQAIAHIASLMLDPKEGKKDRGNQCCQSWKDYFSQEELEQYEKEKKDSQSQNGAYQSGRPRGDSIVREDENKMNPSVAEPEEPRSVAERRPLGVESKNFRFNGQHEKKASADKRTLQAPKLFLYDQKFAKPRSRKQRQTQKMSSRPVTSHVLRDGENGGAKRLLSNPGRALNSSKCNVSTNLHKRSTSTYL